MRLRSMQTENFRAVEDSTPFLVDSLTCLVGKNESGKTSLLQSLFRLNPVEEGVEFDKDLDYPRRHLNEYEERHDGEDANVLTTEWELEADDVAAVEAILGGRALTSKSVTIKKGYSNEQLWTIPIDEDKTLAHLFQAANLPPEDQASVASAKTIAQLKELLGKVAQPSTALAELKKQLDSNFKRGSAALAAIDVLAPRLPKFVYFSQYDAMKGKASIEQLTQRQANRKLEKADEITLSFLALAGFDLKEISGATNTETLIAKLEGVSNRISREVFAYWTQNRRLKVRVDIKQALTEDPAPFNSGRILHTRIENTLHEVTVPFDDRSTGFVWFFSFLVYFSQITKKHGANLILLLDEPGLSLHARAQGDLLRYFKEKLLPKQVLYTTHSPFMVPADNILSVRTVEDVVIERDDGEVEVKGTKVGSDVLSQDRDTLFPLQGALGYDITQSLFVGKNTLVVEGPGDLLYIHAMSRQVEKAGGPPLSRGWTITPARGIDRIASFLALIGAQKMNLAVLTDIGTKQRKTIDDLRKRHVDLLEQGRIFTADIYAGQSEADIEDVLGAELYIHLVNDAYALKGSDRVPAAPAGKRVMEHVEAHFRSLKPPIPEFNHYGPAEFLGRNPGVLDGAPGLAGAVERFGRLFGDLNKLIS